MRGFWALDMSVNSNDDRPSSSFFGSKPASAL